RNVTGVQTCALPIWSPGAEVVSRSQSRFPEPRRSPGTEAVSPNRGGLPEPGDAWLVSGHNCERTRCCRRTVRWGHDAEADGAGMGADRPAAPSPEPARA